MNEPEDQTQNALDPNELDPKDAPADGGPVDFRRFLQTELVRRCQRNSNYSLRAFARALGMSSSALSGMLNGKRTITESSIERIGCALGLAPNDIASYQRKSRAVKYGFAVEAAAREFQQITLDRFAIISDWYHFAILELVRVQGFTPSIAWVAKSLGISKSEANIAIERLTRTGLLEISEDGQTWSDRSNQGNATNINGEQTSVASRKLQKQMLELSLKALEELPTTEQRSHTSLTLAMNPEDLPRAKEMIKNFRRELAQMLEQNPKPTEVYHVSLSLYPVSQISTGGKKS